MMTPKPSQPRPARIEAVPGPRLSADGNGPAPAPGFQPTSVTFIGNTLGAVLGEAGSCGTGPCTAMAGTHDYGNNWTEIGAPDARPANGKEGVSQVRFLNLQHGWAYGPALYATHNGGKTWRAIGTRGGRVIDLSTVGRRAFAVVGFGCTGAGAQYASGCKRFTLFSAAASSNEWDAVRGASGTGQALPGGLQLTSKRGYLLAAGRLYTGPIKNGAWHRVSSAPLPHCLKTASKRAPADRPHDQRPVPRVPGPDDERPGAVPVPGQRLDLAAARHCPGRGDRPVVRHYPIRNHACSRLRQGSIARRTSAPGIRPAFARRRAASASWA